MSSQQQVRGTRVDQRKRVPSTKQPCPFDGCDFEGYHATLDAHIRSDHDYTTLDCICGWSSIYDASLAKHQKKCLPWQAHLPSTSDTTLAAGKDECRRIDAKVEAKMGMAVAVDDPLVANGNHTTNLLSSLECKQFLELFLDSSTAKLDCKLVNSAEFNRLAAARQQQHHKTNLRVFRKIEDQRIYASTRVSTVGHHKIAARVKLGRSTELNLTLGQRSTHHVSHLCGNADCVNFGCLVVETAEENWKRERCFRHRDCLEDHANGLKCKVDNMETYRERQSRIKHDIKLKQEIIKLQAESNYWRERALKAEKPEDPMDTEEHENFWYEPLSESQQKLLDGSTFLPSVRSAKILNQHTINNQSNTDSFIHPSILALGFNVGPKTKL